jgi:hypothetical protein
MPISINGTGTITGISAGGLPDDCITTADIAGSAVTTAKILDANITSAKLAQPLTSGTAQASTSGTAINFTGIPSWAKRITIMLLGVTKAGTTFFRIRVGTGGVASPSGYLGNSLAALNSGIGSANFTAGIDFCDVSTATDVRHGKIELVSLSGNNWVFSGMTSLSSSNRLSYVSGSVALSGVLDMVSITSVGGTSADAFTAGTVNIMYEG